MSEALGGNYESEYAAPPHSIVDQRREGTDMVTTVIIDGELVQFSVPEAIWETCRNLANNKDK